MREPPSDFPDGNFVLWGRTKKGQSSRNATEHVRRMNGAIRITLLARITLGVIFLVTYKKKNKIGFWSMGFKKWVIFILGIIKTFSLRFQGNFAITLTLHDISWWMALKFPASFSTNSEAKALKTNCHVFALIFPRLKPNGSTFFHFVMIGSLDFPPLWWLVNLMA